MSQTTKRLFIAALLAATGGAAIAQAPMPATGEQAPRASGEHHGRRDPAKMHQRMVERHAERMANLKAALALTPAQEGAWNNFVAASQPPARAPGAGMARGDFSTLTTPQRIDLMAQRMTERQAYMQQRGEAVKTFYAQLTPEQQKTFDSRAMRHQGRGEGKWSRHRGTGAH